jgi:diaminopimelate decarboxylase
VAKLVALVQQLDREGIPIRHLDIGGGLGIPYDEEKGAEPPSPADYGAAVKAALAPLSLIAASVIIISKTAQRINYLRGNVGKIFL